MRHGSLFSGIGGFEVAAASMGWENIFHCEIDPFPAKVLNYHFPNSIAYEDIKETNFKKHKGSIDIISGGFPCQPYSSAGKRLGKEDDRHLWPEMLRVIREVSPRWVVGENVRGLTTWNEGLVFHEVCTDLENLGYRVFPCLLPAAGVNAPHKRERIWFIAYSDDSGTEQRVRGKREGQEGDQLGGQQSEPKSRQGSGTATNSDPRLSKRAEEQIQAGRNATPIGCEDFGISDQWVNTNSWSDGQRWDSSFAEVYGGGVQERVEERPEPDPSHDFGNAPDTHHYGLQGKRVSESDDQERWEAPRRRSSEYTSDDWGAFLSDRWQNFPTQPPVCGGNDELPEELHAITFPKWRHGAIKAYGNAVVPGVVIQIFKAIEAYENENL